jgi:hypothetical protein
MQPTLGIKEELEHTPYAELIERIKEEGGQRAFSRTYGIARSTLQLVIERARQAQFKHIPPREPRIENVSKGQGVRRFILTAAQDGTKVHEAFLSNLEAYRDWLSDEGPCELMIAGFTYNKKLFEEHRKTEVIWADRLKPHMVWERVRLNDVVDFCGEMNTLPTAKTPLTGFETYTRHRWGIFPHAKVQLRSIATMKHEPSKQIMTTGVCTLPNYVQKRAGIEATFHHVIGAVLVECREDGRFFCRHLLGDTAGSFYDLDRLVSVGQVTTGHRVKALNHGDLHIGMIDPVVARATFGFYPLDHTKGTWAHVDLNVETPMLDALKPEYQFFHDSLNFGYRNHHNIKDGHLMFMQHVIGQESVERECAEDALFTENTKRPWCKTVKVASNHDGALKKWLNTADYRLDPVNAIFFLKAQLAVYEAIERRDPNFSIYEHVLTTAFPATPCRDVIFLREDESFKLLGIEYGMHGHLGVNGARGSPAAFTKAGSKATTGHTHSCEIRDGIYTAGTSSLLDMGYNCGLSSWSHSAVVTYQNGKRAIITFNRGMWKA